jgi:hypothetical protein
MAVNPWNLATATFLDDLAQREARQRQAQLDAQRTAELEADRAMRERQMQLSQRQVDASIANQNADNDRANADQINRANAATSAAKQKARQEEELASLMAMYRTAQDPSGRQQAADNLSLRGVRVPEQAQTPKNLAESLIAKGMDPEAAYRAAAKFSTDENIRQSNSTRAPREGADGAFMSLDAKTRQYLDTLPTKVDPATGQPYTMQRALDEVRRQQGLAGLQGAITPYLQRIFPEQDQGIGLPAVQPGTPPAAAAAPQGDAVTQAAIAKLQERGIAVTPETIAQAKALIAAGQ